MFPTENFELIYGRWEDDIIYDSDAVEYLPRPSLPLVDPNDPNIILGVPEEPPPSIAADTDKKVLSLPLSFSTSPLTFYNLPLLPLYSGHKEVSFWCRSF